jgi:hypothetical protein
MIDRDTSTTTAAPELKPHETSLAIWDVPSPLVVGRSSKLKVGVRCSSGCSLAGQKVQIHDATQQHIAEAAVGPTPWSGTAGLYWTELDVVAPDIEGTHTWTAEFVAANLDPPHLRASSNFTVNTVKPPDHRVTVEILQQDTKAPIDVSEVRLGIYRTVTNTDGIARLDVPKGTYELSAWKLGFDLVTQPVEVSEDLTIKLELPVTVEPEMPYWLG